MRGILWIDKWYFITTASWKGLQLLLLQIKIQLKETYMHDHNWIKNQQPASSIVGAIGQQET